MINLAWIQRSLMAFMVGVSFHSVLLGQAGTKGANSSEPRCVSRVFFQDDVSKTLKWADLFLGQTLTLGKVKEVAGFPKLDPEKQTLVQMESARGYLMVGVRDEEDGEYQSGWVLIESGVEEEEHGDHSHWHYAREPKVRASMLDEHQGNPAHLYCYDQVFYLANDRLNGYTRMAPAEIVSSDGEEAIRKKAAFHAGGGGHITLAAHQGKLGFATWIDRDGDHKGQVDITALHPSGAKSVRGSFFLPSGGIHGAAECSGKVFFAPSDGLCWIDVPKGTSWKPADIAVQHVSLGKKGEQPVRTGAFTRMENHLGFTTGSGEDAKLHWIQANVSPLSVATIGIPMHSESRPAGLQFVRDRKKTALGFVFHDHPREVEAPCKLTILQMDPNRDGRWNDAKIDKTIEVGSCRIEGHGGHHSLDVTGDGRRAVFSNPGDGTLSVIALEERMLQATFPVGGAPSKVITVGGR